MMLSSLNSYDCFKRIIATADAVGLLTKLVKDLKESIDSTHQDHTAITMQQSTKASPPVATFKQNLATEAVIIYFTARLITAYALPTASTAAFTSCISLEPQLVIASLS